MAKLLGSFLGQVKGQVTRGHLISNVADFNIFLQSGTYLRNQKSYSTAEKCIQ